MQNESQRLSALWHFLAKDTHLSLFVTDADVAQFKTRLGAEGLSFLTVSLPALGKALDRSFQTGSFECPDGWARAKNAAYPAFLHKAWEELFDFEGQPRWFVTDGESLDLPLLGRDDTQGLAVLCIRQLTFAFYKYEQPWTDEQANLVCTAFQTAETELWDDTCKILSTGTSNMFVNGTSLRTYLDRAERLIGRLLEGVDPHQINPKYGTGATADKATPWGRWQEPRLISKLDAVYPYYEWFFSGINGADSHMRNSALDLLVCDDPGARVVLVPKDSRGPRLISAEPREFMYIQQGVLPELVSAVERYENVRRQVSIIDQSRNQYLALLGSQTGSHASLDLQEASDRHSWWLVTRLFPSNWVEALDSCRSEYTVMPNGDEIPLTKFAPMGSACCFPVMAIVLWALSNAARKDWSERRFAALFDQSNNTKALPEGLASLGGPVKVQDVCVFGDDIIVETDHVGVTVALLELVGFRVNKNKSFTKGPFRESCGGDYFVGYNVTPVRVKSVLRGDSIDVVFQTKDIFNRMSLVYGDTCPNVCVKLRELYQEFFGFKPPLLSCNGVDGTNGLILYDYHWMQTEPGETLRKVPQHEGGGYKVIKARRNRKRAEAVVTTVKENSKGEKWVSNHLPPWTGSSEIRVLTEVALTERHDLNWSSVLRSFCVSGGRGGTDIYALRKRVRHKLAWIVE
jgi:hypothetical protein